MATPPAPQPSTRELVAVVCSFWATVAGVVALALAVSGQVAPAVTSAVLSCVALAAHRAVLGRWR